MSDDQYDADLSGLQPPAGDGASRDVKPGRNLNAATADKYEKINPVRGCFRRFPRALLAVAGVSTPGTIKHGVPLDDVSYLELPDAKYLFEEAGARHLLHEAITGPVDHDFDLLHKAHKAWDALADLEVTLKHIEGIHGTETMNQIIEGRYQGGWQDIFPE